MTLVFFPTELRMAFRLLDKNKDGRISVSEFQCMLHNFGIEVPDEMVQEFITSKSRTGKYVRYMKTLFVMMLYGVVEQLQLQ